MLKIPMVLPKFKVFNISSLPTKTAKLNIYFLPYILCREKANSIYERRDFSTMKFSCDKHQLVETVTNVQRAVSVKSTIPSLEGILLKTSEETVTLCGYNLELGMTTVLQSHVEEPGKIVISAKLFGDIVRRLPNDQVTISVDDNNRMTIVSGESTFTITGIPAEEYPDLPTVHDEDAITISQGMLKNMIRQTIFAVAESDAKPIHTGTLFELCPDCFRLVSVDGYRLAVREEKMNCSKNTNFVVPGKTLSELLRLLKDDGDETVTLHIATRHIVFTLDNYTLVSRLLEGEFLDYHSALPKQKTTEITVKVRDFVESVERVSLLITDRLKSPIRCIFENDEIRLFCSTPIGRANDRFPAHIQGQSLEMGFNNRYLLDALRNSECDEVKISLSGAISPMLITPKDSEEFLFLVLPVRLKADY